VIRQRDGAKAHTRREPHDLFRRLCAVRCRRMKMQIDEARPPLIASLGLRHTA
jgi:hypothetical protein